MSLRRLPVKPAPKKVPMTFEMKEILKYEEGKWIIDIAQELGKASSTIPMILKKKKDIKGFAASKGVTLIASKKKRSESLNKVKNLLLVWIN